ncbi:hypothetical protein [Corallococcus silvisoli]|uniref:hypothetical protein n=1 Tax=Corallococcus silvisoli TaxID=2697031 RepID=UPI001377315F|nr:hypothetical protein [Corallococcus silvisoli]NBD11857.1 hypothetical protein [Corallococcus silvisoli]
MKQTQQGVYESMERDGREMLERWVREARVKVRACKHSGTQVAKTQQRIADRYAAVAKDTTRNLWCITVSGYGEFYWVGTPASAHGRRVAKLRWEGGHSSRCVAVRPARDDEPNGETDYQPHAASLAAVVAAEAA